MEPSLIQLHRVVDARGMLIAGTGGDQIPFTPIRFFTVIGVPPNATRGGHAHRICHQLLVAAAGSLRVDVRPLEHAGRTVKSFLLRDPSVGLHVPPFMHGTQSEFSPDAVLLVLASHAYDPEDYIDDDGPGIVDLRKDQGDSSATLQPHVTGRNVDWPDELRNSP